ncbi:MAG TPA: hypothetical protein VFD44_06005 [Hanamia sp.]|nr:hypothetical protein [Hanamia sp.]
MRRWTIINVLLLLIMAFSTIALIALILCNKQDQNLEKSNSIKTDAVSLYQELSMDSLNKKQGYVNNVFTVSGKVKQVE